MLRLLDKLVGSQDLSVVDIPVGWLVPSITRNGESVAHRRLMVCEGANNSVLAVRADGSPVDSDDVVR